MVAFRSAQQRKVENQRLDRPTFRINCANISYLLQAGHQAKVGHLFERKFCLASEPKENGSLMRGTNRAEGSMARWVGALHAPTGIASQANQLSSWFHNQLVYTQGNSLKKSIQNK